MNYAASHKRSLVKSITFRIIVVIVDTLVAYGLTHRVDITAGFVILSNVSSSVLYYLHERLWNRSKWGKLAQDEPPIPNA